MQLAGSDGGGYPSGGTLLGPFSDLSLYKTKSPVPRAITHVGCTCNFFSFLAKGNQKKKKNKDKTTHKQQAPWDGNLLSLYSSLFKWLDLN